MLKCRMARLTRYKYTRLTALDDLLRDAPKIGRPRKIDEVWLKARGVGTNGETVISVLRFVGLIRHDGTPTDLWDSISNPSPHNKVRFADAVRTAYDDLFALYPHAHREDDDALSTFFRSQVQGQEQVQRGILKTFRTLTKFGDFDTDPELSQNKTIELPELVLSVEDLERKTREWLDMQSEIQARLEVLAPLRKRMDELSLEKDELLRDSITAAEANLFRASHVLAWSGFTDFLYEPFVIDEVSSILPKVKTRADLYRFNDHDLIEVGKRLGLYDNTTMKTLHGLLNDRNRCAHGSRYAPDVNETIGFLSKILHMINDLKHSPTGRWT